MTDFLSFTLRQHNTQPQYYFIEAKTKKHAPNTGYEPFFRAQWRELARWCRDNGYNLTVSSKVPDDPHGKTWNVVECTPAEAAAFTLRWR